MSAPMLTLYAYGDALDAIKADLYEAEGVLTPEMEAALDQAEGDFQMKVERVALFIREMQANAKAVKEEATRLSQRAGTYEKTADSLKRYLQAQMERAEIPKVEGRLVNVRLQKSPPSVTTTMSQEQLAVDVPARFVVIAPQTYRLDSKAVIDAWKLGEDVEALLPGTHVEQNVHLRIS